MKDESAGSRMIEWDRFWGPPYLLGPEEPATLEAIRRWEQRHGLPLPATLAKALTLQNGGCVRGNELVIYPISEFSTLEGREWDRLFEDGRGDVERAKLIRIGVEDDSQASVVLDYNAGREPNVLLFHHDSGDGLQVSSESFDDYLRGMRGGRSRPPGPG